MYKFLIVGLVGMLGFCPWALAADPPLQGDFDGSGVLDIGDLRLLLPKIGKVIDETNNGFDLNSDGLVNAADGEFWVTSESYFDSWIGDADLNKEFNSGDLVSVLFGGFYETGFPFADWSTGDFNFDTFFNSSDFVVALSDGGYEQGPRPANASVPEPSSAVLIFIGMGAWATASRRSIRRNPERSERMRPRIAVHARRGVVDYLRVRRRCWTLGTAKS